jgi:membrane protease subunit (stomatin/prohibitin family)
MTPMIQRPAEHASALFWCARTPPTPFPLSSQLVVGTGECVVAHLDGSILGVIPPGNHWLHPQPFPFLAPSVVGGASIRAELWFVRTSRMAGLPIGGSLAQVTDPGTQVPCNPRGFGDYSLTVVDPAKLVRSSLGQAANDPAPLLGWVTSVLARTLSAAFGRLVEIEGVGVLDGSLIPRLSQALDGQLGEIEAAGVKFGGLGSYQVNLSEEDAQAVRRVTTAKAEAARAAKIAKMEQAATIVALQRCARCGSPQDAGRFCTACGASLVP